jgi:hypothetical protein
MELTDREFLLNLQNKKFDGVKKVIKVPGADEIFTANHGTLYGIKYFFHTNEGVKILRITYKDKKLKSFYSIDAIDYTGFPIEGYVIKPDKTNDEVLKFINELLEAYKISSKGKQKINESNVADSGKKTIAEQIMSEGRVMNLVKPFWVPITFLSIGTIAKMYYLIASVIKWTKEKYVAGPVEQKINHALFSDQMKREPVFDAYAGTINFIEHVIEGNAPAFIICGPPGMSKTYIVRRTLYFNDMLPGKDYTIVKGSALGMSEVYSLLYKNRNKILVLDDFDTPLGDENMVNMLKSITDSYSRRIISFPREALMRLGLEGEEPEAPDKFEFKGKILIITNLTRDQINRALVSRAPTFEVKFNTEEVVKMIEDFMRFIAPEVDMNIKKEVYQYILELYKNDRELDLSFRGFKSSIDARIGNPFGWKEMVKIIVGYKGK